jgi:hypothetical protein
MQRPLRTQRLSFVDWPQNWIDLYMPKRFRAMPWHVSTVPDAVGFAAEEHLPCRARAQSRLVLSSANVMALSVRHRDADTARSIDGPPRES